jgi:hypothetical protein
LAVSIAVSVVAIGITPATADWASQPVVLISDTAAGVVANYEITFKVTPALSAGSSISVAAPTGTAFAVTDGNICADVYVTDQTNSSDSGVAASCTLGPTGSNAITFTLSRSIGAGDVIDIFIERATNPTNPSMSDVLTITTPAATYNSLPYAIEERAVVTPTVEVANNAVNATTSYTVRFTTGPARVGGAPTPPASGQWINMTAPVGTKLLPGLSCAAVDITDLSEPANSASATVCEQGVSNSITINDPKTINANNAFSVQLPAVTNPPTASSADVLTISTSADESPTASAPYGIGMASLGSGPNAPVNSLGLTRLAGVDRDATAVAASNDNFPSPGSAQAVVLASDAVFPDALAGAPLAAAEHGPLLLTSRAALSPEARAEIQRVLPRGGAVFVLGGTAAVSADVDTALQDLGYAVTRLAGADRAATAVAIAGALGNPTTIVEATGLNFPDGLSAAAAAVHLNAAVLLTSGATQAPETSAYAAAHSGAHYAVGGPACKADTSATCVMAGDRYSTAVAVAQRFFSSPITAGFASGRAFPDALSGGAQIGAQGGPLLLVPSSGALPSSLVGYLASTTSITTGDVYGGNAALDDDVVKEIG